MWGQQQQQQQQSLGIERASRYPAQPQRDTWSRSGSGSGSTVARAWGTAMEEEEEAGPVD